MDGQSRRIVGADAWKLYRTVLNCAMYWDKIFQLWWQRQVMVGVAACYVFSWYLQARASMFHSLGRCSVASFSGVTSASIINQSVAISGSCMLARGGMRGNTCMHARMHAPCHCVVLYTGSHRSWKCVPTVRSLVHNAPEASRTLVTGRCEGQVFGI